MMSVSDQDLELLENYLDDELSSADQDLLRRRLSSEPELSAAMDALRDQRQMRSQWLSSVEPSGEEVEHLIKSVQKGMMRERVWGGRSRVLRRVGAVAACLLVGFLGGYGLRGFGTATNSSYPTAMVNGQTPVSFEQQQPPEPIAFNGSNIGTLSTSQGGQYQIRIVDESGHVIGMQRFDSAEKAQQFREQFANWQSQHQQLKEGIKTAP